ncbi:acrosomal protein KIAA1210 homolog isoform X2 [Mastomys coucha]|uniref:acrosomal protein KIAA1210 homolog isoform X2 n=1 Tax=Mastomys coucha TaxID=35658 RepID=UPI0012619EC6|nr:acrosomal protein KIAA1210 homolog isoform X2 [Mastomys coucha]
MKSKPKSGMGTKSISHDSIFCMDPEPEKAAGKLYSSPVPQRSRSLKSFSELSSDPELFHFSESSSQLRWGFGTPASSQGCLDSSAAKAKIALSPRKQQQQKSSPPTSVKVKQEEQVYSVPGKEKTTTKTKQPEQKEQRLDSTGLSSQEQSYKTETQEKTVDEILHIEDAASYCILGLNPRRRRRRAKNEWGIIERGLLKSTQGYSMSTKAESSATEEIPGIEHSFLKLFLEKKGTGQPTTTEAEITSLQERPSDRGIVEGELADINVEAQRAPAPQPIYEDVAESVISGPSPYCEHGPSEGKKKKDKAGVLPWIRKSSSQEEITVLRKEEAQVHMRPSEVCGKEEEASSTGLQRFQPQMELSLESTTYHKEKHPKSSFRALSTSVSSVTTEDDASTQITPLPLRRWPNAGEISSDSKSTSEYESSSEVQLGPTHSFQPARKLKDNAGAAADKEDGDDDEEEDNDEEDDVFLKSENVGVGLSKMERQQPLKYSSQALGKPQAREASAELESSSEDGRSCEEMTSAHSSQSLEEFEECSESRSFTKGSNSEEQPAATRCHSQALQVLEEKEVSTESSSYIEKYHSSEDLSSLDEEQREVSLVSKSGVLKQWSAPVKPLRPMHTSALTVSSTTQQQPPIMVNISVGPNKSVKPLLPTHTAKSGVRPQSEHQVLAKPEGVVADWDIFMQPVSPRKTLKGYHVDQNVPSSSDIVNMEEGGSKEAVLLRQHSQPLTRPKLEQEVSAGSELTVFEESIAAQPSGYPLQPSMRPNIKKELPSGAHSAALDSPPSQLLLKPSVHQQVSAFERGVSMDPKLPIQFKPRMKPQGKQSSSSTPESMAFEGSTSMDPMTLTLPQPYQMPLESETVAAKMISTGQLHSKYSAHTLPSHQSQPVPESASVEDTILVELQPPQPSVTPKFQPLMTQDPVSTSSQWSSPMEPTSAKHMFQTQANPKFKQGPVGSDSPEAQGSMSMQPVPPQPWLKPTFEQISVPSGSVPAAWAIPIYSPAPRMPLMGPVVKQPVSRGPMDTSVQQITAVKPKPSWYSLQPRQNMPLEQVSVSPDHAAAAASWSVPINPHSQPLMGSVVKQPTSIELASASVPQSSSLEPSRSSFQPRADPEHYVAKEEVSTLRRPKRQHSQPPVTSEFKEEVSPGSPRASREQSIPLELMPPKYAPQPWSGPEFEQQASSLEGVAKEGDVLREAWLSGHPSQTITKHKVEKSPSSFESTSKEGVIPWRSLLPKCSKSRRSKVQEMSSRLESAITQGSSKKPQNIKAPSQSFVKFMTQQVFSESTASELNLYPKLATRSRRRPSRSQLKSKLIDHISLYNWDDETKEDSTLKNLPMKQPFQLSRRPKEPQEVLPLSEGAPGKWSTSAGDVSQPLGKLKYKKKVSVPVSFPDEWKRSRGQLPSTEPSQAFDVAELQSSLLPADSANVPVVWKSSEGHQSPQSFSITDYQVHAKSAKSAAEGTVPEKNTGCWPMLKGPPSTKDVKYGQGYGDITKSTPTSVIKPATFASAPAQKQFVSMDTYFKDEVPQCYDVSGSSSLPFTSKADVENVFGVRLRRTSKEIGIQNPDPCKPIVPVSSAASKEEANKGAFQGSDGGPEKSSPALSLKEKQGNRPRYEGTLKKAAVYRPPEKISSRKADSPMEPGWITMLKQRQRGLVSQVPKKPKTRFDIRTETKEPRYDTKYQADLEIVPKEFEPVTDIPQKMTSLSTVARHKLPQFRQTTKSVAFDDQTVIYSYTKEKESRRSSSLPPRFPQPEEPEWFLMAKKKAQAWSQIADAMH